MKTVIEMFHQRMEDAEFQVWYFTRPDVIRCLIQRYPFEKYVVKPEAPYGISCPGQVVYIFGYQENGEVTVRIPAQELTEDALKHILKLCELHKKDFETMKARDCCVNVDPAYLEAIEC